MRCRLRDFHQFLCKVIAIAFEYLARYYRRSIRELHRTLLIQMSTVFQVMVEAIIGAATVRAFATSQRVICRGIEVKLAFMEG